MALQKEKGVKSLHYQMHLNRIDFEKRVIVDDFHCSTNLSNFLILGLNFFEPLIPEPKMTLAL